MAKDVPGEVLAKLPEKAGVFTADDEGRTYDSPGLGASRAYRVPGGTWITVYLYDLDKEVIRTGIEDKTIKNACEQAKGDILEMERQGQYADVKMAEDSKVTLELKSGKKLTFFSVTYSLSILPREKEKDEKGKTKVFSQLFVTGLRNHIFKIRVSRPEGRAGATAEETEEALKALINAVAIIPAKADV